MKHIDAPHRRALLRALTTLTLLLSATLTFAPESAAQAAHDEPHRPSYHLFDDIEVALNLGTFGALQTEQVFEAGLEARLSPFEFFDLLRLRPIAGASLLDDGGNYWYLGARTDLVLDDATQTTLGLSFAPGIYSPGGIDLGGPVEFRSGIDLNYEILDGVRAGVGLYHLSNGGLYSRNRGSESILFTLASEL